MTIKYRLADWRHDRAALSAVRHQVFVVEQGVPEELEWDEHDATAVHFLAEHSNRAIATARLKIDDAHTGQIGRMAVLSTHRNRGIGSQLLRTVIDYCEQVGIVNLYLHAQLTAIKFYEKFGFEPAGEIFIDAGIEHRAMLRNYAKKRL